MWGGFVLRASPPSKNTKLSDNLNTKITMNKKIWKTILDIAITVLTAIAATLTTQSCM